MNLQQVKLTRAKTITALWRNICLALGPDVVPAKDQGTRDAKLNLDKICANASHILFDRIFTNCQNSTCTRITPAFSYSIKTEQANATTIFRNTKKKNAITIPMLWTINEGSMVMCTKIELGL